MFIENGWQSSVIVITLFSRAATWHKSFAMLLEDSSSVTVNNDSDMNRMIDQIDEWLINNCSIYVMLV